MSEIFPDANSPLTVKRILCESLDDDHLTVQQTVGSIVEDGLKLGEYGGLCYPEDDCGCRLGNLRPCSGPWGECIAAYEGVGKEGGWRMFVNEEEAKKSKENPDEN